MEFVPISALQHYAFCPRQCAYIHVERLWQDNFLTAKGNRLHDRVPSSQAETRGNLRTERGAQVCSEKYGIQGKLDLLEIESEPYKLIPVEYKRGKPKVTDCDRIQLCAQALCLEEMKRVEIHKAALWYWQVRQREWVEINDALRQTTLDTIHVTRELIAQASLPPARYFNGCKACSFFDHCMPKQTDRSARYTQELFQV